ncbi:MAG: aspartate kinase, partial [Xanthomonadales bacterium]|nr:aspartate kinase [Xanthomonadales bacterium]
MTVHNMQSNSRDAGWRVMKFGGTSVSSADRWHAIAQQVQRARADGFRVLVVVSALKGVTDRLQALAAAEHKQPAPEILAGLWQEHEALLNHLSLTPDPAFHHAWEALLADLAAPLSGAAAHSAQVQARGEDLSAALGAQILTELAAPCCHSPSLELLACEPELSQGPLSAYCAAGVDRDLAQRLAAAGPLHITQGFQVAGPDGRPWLLGRGGSDTSAALLAARLAAKELEIWTDVPGVFSADPARVPEARLLRQLSYSEAQEFAAMGAKVLHPPCIAPLQAHGIRLSIRDTGQPEAPHTQVGPRSAETQGLIKGVVSRRNVTLISMDSPSMWHQPGFLADAFGLFKRHGLSIDLISTSESSVTVSLDPLRPGSPVTRGLEACLEDLSRLCTVQLRTECVAVSLVGNAMRTLLGRLGDAFDLFQDRTVHMVTQSANDLNFTVVVDAAQSDRLVQSLHAKLIDATAAQHDAFGPSWSTLKAAPVPQPTPWWEQHRADLLALAQAGPAYVYHLPAMREAARRLLGLRSIDRVLYAMKANDHPEVLRALYAEGVSFECVSPGEVAHALREIPELDPKHLLCTPNFASREDYEAV